MITISKAEKDLILEPSREIPVARRAQVLVVGGGPAGIGAALAAARTGADTILVERYGFLGGMWTAGLLNPFLDHKRKGGIINEIVGRMDKEGYMHRKTHRDCFDNEYMKYLLDQMMIESNVSIMLHQLAVDAIVDDGHICGIITESKSGRRAILADVVIDCTGDGDISYLAGVPYEKGRPVDGLMQPMTLYFRLGNVKFELPDKYTTYDMIMEAVEAAGVEYRLPYKTPTFMPLPLTDQSAVQITHVYGVDGTSAEDLTFAEIEGRRQIHEAVEILRKYVTQFADVQLTQSATQIGVRETRRILGRYQLTLEDMEMGRTFEDGILWVHIGVDIHGPRPPWEETEERIRLKTKPYQIPYRSLLPIGIEDLLVAGRCISGTHEALASYRMTGDCVGMGQAAGTAAALAVQNGISPSKVDTGLLVQRLRQDGVVI